MLATFRKWLALFSVYLKDGIAYRVNGIIWILTDAFTMFTMPLVWMSAMGGGRVAGFNKGDIVRYYLAMLMVSGFVVCHFMWELAIEIKDGQFSAQLVRPISTYQVYFFRNFSWRIVRMSLCVPFLLLFMWFYRGILHDATFNWNWQFFSALLLGHLLSFTTVMMLGFIALFVEEAMALFELYYFPMLFLSGQVVPVAMLPDWAQQLAKVLPFYYTTNLPVDIGIGRVGGDTALVGLGVQCFYIALTFGISKILWAKGLRQFSGVGL
ncbi:MAG: ABC-2 family transporter protein [Armatimonadetes bacterium]|nr:hypothetical protein [Armatimonadota bacterium]MBS1704050.1 ABC-2 family transporter protein [Armatimonadota bacterium]MBS1725606.1 ABC-2 family transporter protein [Armatimonadota bacterium]